MKKTLKILFGSFLVVGLLSVTLGQVFASSGGATASDPVVTLSNPGVMFTAVILEPSQLPGLATSPSDLILPLGFPSGQAQFDGNGVKVSGLKTGQTVKVTFNFPFYNFDWAGSIYMWTGTKWMKMTTLFTTGTDGTSPSASVSGAGNGVYVLIMGNYGLPEVQPTEVPTPDDE
jgi:hypothetical protein